MSRRRLTLFVLGAAVVLHAESARTQEVRDPKEACFRAVDEGQKLRTQRKLVEARDRFIECARPVCPALIRKDCGEWLSEAQIALPSVVLGAKDAQGKDLLDVRVLVDGQVLAEKLDGTSVVVDPGSHAYRFEWSGHGVVEQEVLIREGEKSRLVTVSFPATEVPPPKAQPIPVGVWVFGALAVASAGSFAGFYVASDVEINHLKSTCSPNCPPSDLDGIRTKIAVTYASLGIGIASAGLATTWFLLSRSPRGEAAAVSVGVAPGGGSANLRVWF